MSEKRVELAAKIDGLTYDELRRRFPMEIAQEAQTNGCVIVYGMSDDLLEFIGAINDEIGAYDGTTAYVAHGKLMEKRCDECAECKLYENEKKNAIEIKATWDHMGYSWFIIATCEYTPFTIYDDGETYCRGIVIEV